MKSDIAANKNPTVSLADEEAVKQILSSAVFGLWDVVNNLSRLRPSKREHYRVTIFGSARQPSKNWNRFQELQNGFIIDFAALHFIPLFRWRAAAIATFGLNQPANAKRTQNIKFWN